VHVDDIELVIHVDPPMEHKAYLHRSGRTARAGSEGDVVTICLPTQKKDLAALLKKADQRKLTAGDGTVHAWSFAAASGSVVQANNSGI